MSPAPGVSPSPPTPGWHRAPAGPHVSQRTHSTALRETVQVWVTICTLQGLALTGAPSPPHHQTQSVSQESTFSESHQMEPVS